MPGRDAPRLEILRPGMNRAKGSPRVQRKTLWARVSITLAGIKRDGDPAEGSGPTADGSSPHPSLACKFKAAALSPVFCT